MLHWYSLELPLEVGWAFLLLRDRSGLDGLLLELEDHSGALARPGVLEADS